jgi:Spy/CpxP family protein refolding chaperone
MSKISLIAALALGGLVAFSTLATAQDASKAEKKGRKGMPTVEQQLEKMTTVLSLTDEQKPKVEKVLKETDKKMKELGQDADREKRQEIRNEQTKKMKEILTAEQFTKYEEYVKNMRAGKKGGKKKAE